MYSVGVLYSIQEFLTFVAQNPVVGSEFEKIGSRFVLASSGDVFSASLRCGWVELNDSGVCVLTTRGREILTKSPAEVMLRYQLYDLIEVFQPSWAMKIRAGRAEVKPFLPPAVEQIFREAGLFAEWSDEIVAWWDTLAQAVRMRKADALLLTGRKAERRSCEYERDRTGKEPHWQSIDSNYSGFDILSIVSPTDRRPMKIEVKGTEQRLKEAYFTVTRNEWQTAESATVYRFHLWILRGKGRLIKLDAADVAPHVPGDCGSGKWESVRIRFKAFA